jgi:hypothetical protein
LFTAILPETTATTAADLYPSTTETAAEESATSAAATTSAAPISSLPERPKAVETAAPAVVEPIVAPVETDAAHAKRPYEKPIFSNDEVKPHKIAKTEEEQAAASAAAARLRLLRTPSPSPFP